MNLPFPMIITVVTACVLGGCELFPMDSGGNDSGNEPAPAAPAPSPSPSPNPSPAPAPALKPAPAPSAGDSSNAKLDGSVTGSVTYLQRIAMPPDAVITVKLMSVGQAGVPPVMIAEQVIRNPTGVPVPFELKFDKGRINEKNIYTVQAKLTSGGTLRFSSTKSYPVLTRGKGNTAEIIMSMPN